MVVISFDFSFWIINEFEKDIWRPAVVLSSSSTKEIDGEGGSLGCGGGA